MRRDPGADHAANVLLQPEARMLRRLAPHRDRAKADQETDHRNAGDEHLLRYKPHGHCAGRRGNVKHADSKERSARVAVRIAFEVERPPAHPKRGRGDSQQIEEKYSADPLAARRGQCRKAKSRQQHDGHGPNIDYARSAMRASALARKARRPQRRERHRADADVGPAHDLMQRVHRDPPCRTTPRAARRVHRRRPASPSRAPGQGPMTRD